MANTDQLFILKSDVILFNNLREGNYNNINSDKYDIDYLSKIDFTNIDLSGANLENLDLGEVNLSHTDLRYANLCGSNLNHSNLSGAILESVDLSFADLSSSDLGSVYFKSATLFRTNFSMADLGGSYLREANCQEAIFDEANLWHADLHNANLYKANLISAKLSYSDLSNTNLSYADLSKAMLNHCIIYQSDFSSAVLKNASLYCSSVVETNFIGTDLEDCVVYGISAWNNVFDNTTKQINLVISKTGESKITVDNIEVAQFIYLLINNNMIRNVINTITSKVVLILGRFGKDTKPILNTIRKELRKYNYVPVMFDFDKPSERNFIETVSTLAHMAKFVIADFTDAKIVLQEAEHIIPAIVIPFAPIMLKDSGFEPITLHDLRRGRTYILDTFYYENLEHLIKNLYKCIIVPSEKKASELIDKNPLN